MKQPKCSNCDGAGVQCLTFHASKQAEDLLRCGQVPRNYVSDLEKQVEALTQQVRRLERQSRPTPLNGEASNSPALSHSSTRLSGISPLLPAPSASDGSSGQVRDLVKSVKDVVVEPSRQPRFVGQSSGITLAKMVMAAVRVDATTPSSANERHQDNAPASISAIERQASLPPRHAADHLVDVYFQYRTPHLPILERAPVKEALGNAYQAASSTRTLDHAVKKDVFTTYMVLAIALFDVPVPSGGRPSQSEGCFQSAVGLAEHVISYSPSDLETLRAVLLLAQYVALCPSRGSFWHLTGFALRLCIDVGLHWETEEQSMQTDAAVLHERRSLWYCTYQFDRMLCILLGRPFGILDESTRVPLPGPYTACLSHDAHDAHCYESYNSLFKMSKLESEIKHVLHNQTWEPKLAYPRVDYSAWLEDIQPRLQHWYETIPEPQKAHPSTIFAHRAYWDAVYSNAILLLHRPHSIAQHPSTESLFMTFDASTKLITSIKSLQREGKIDIHWKAVHELFMAGLGIVYVLWLSEELRRQRTASSSISTLNSCASTLSALSESFAGAAGCRDAFETLSAATIDWLLTHDAEQERQTRLALERQVEDLLQQLRPPREGMAMPTAEDDASYMSNMLSMDNFAFSEMLSSTAQWPSFENMEYVDMNHHSVNEMGFGTDWWQ
ncbi:uncharacterized protein LTR77_010254 [Saxophila tyrrhenica]|uniref:Xylanolytic transcriptional activator regulatory domain-containing protein n=1 Tax=Saxophila tyrrhenica TaxID=1690608 RepID=A0AAV9NVV5_9PEZI|nr:hypothetical protein LTR77_010254 [Saxophila tyrrhenica]